ncbi:MAG: phosphatidylglycerophosphatase A [Candidatus Aminicenantes bacterium]|nr:phosphatidylglycerophosphatase A [Candidatus Aminicenantes bacterium]
MKKPWVVIATFFGTGFLPVAPGTWASFLTALIVYVTPLSSAPILTYILAVGIVSALGVPAATASEHHFKDKDPQPCVIDEVAGQMIALWLLPRQALLYIAAVFIFRAFDIVKPFPILLSESLPRGFGIMTDDILAGLYTLGVLLAFHRIFLGPIPI